MFALLSAASCPVLRSRLWFSNLHVNCRYKSSSIAAQLSRDKGLSLGSSLAKISRRQTLAVRHLDQSCLTLLHHPGHHCVNRRPERDALLTVQEHLIQELCPQSLVSPDQSRTATLCCFFCFPVCGDDANIQFCIMQQVPMQRRKLLSIQSFSSC